MRIVYLATVGFSVTATILLIAPVGMHLAAGAIAFVGFAALWLIVSLLMRSNRGRPPIH